MKKLLSFALLSTTMAVASPAWAGSNDGKLQVKVMGSYVITDGKITSVELDTLGLPAGSQTRADESQVPTIAAEYFITPNISVETICCITEHDVTGTGPVDGATLISNADVLPATLTLKYHMQTGLGFKPYIGAGPAYFFFIGEEPGATTSAAGATRQQLNDKFGGVVQAGVDVPLNDQGLGLSVDVKRYFLNTTAFWFDKDGNQLLRTRHRVDPWLLSAGVAYRF